MFCPQCHAEYRPGFIRCADCDVDLVDALPPEQFDQPAQSSQLNDPRTIWIGDSESDCVEQCRDLQETGIPYEVTQLVKDRRKGMQVVWRYEIRVAAKDELRAKELLQLPEKVVEWDSDVPDEPDETEALPEEPASLDSDSDANRRAHDYLKPFYPEDASVEVWRFKADSYNQVEASLKENYIRVRVEPQPDGSRKIFVLPEDEAAAREIVREIHEGSVPS